MLDNERSDMKNLHAIEEDLNSDLTFNTMNQ